MTNHLLNGKLRFFGEFCSFGALAGVMFQVLREGFVDHNAFIIWITLGSTFGVLELIILARFQKTLAPLPLLLTIFIKAFTYLVVISIVSMLLAFIVGFLRGKTMDEFYTVAFGMDHFILIIYTFILFVLMTFYTQINLLLGNGVLQKFLLGQYRKPKPEKRIFLFLDLKSSTSMAERLGLKKYYSLLNDFFHEISEPVLSTGAEIYQYVGDEVIFTWKTKEGIKDMNCVMIFFKIAEKITISSNIILTNMVRSQHLKPVFMLVRLSVPK